MKVVILTVKKATQAKLLIRPNLAVVKIPKNLPIGTQKEIRSKFTKIIDLNENTNQSLKAYYKVGTPYVFLNKKLPSTKKRKTATVYTFADL